MQTRSKTPRQIPFDPSKYIDWSELENTRVKDIPHCQKFYVGLIIIVVMALIVRAYKS
jgi:hypothetical protein